MNPAPPVIRSIGPPPDRHAERIVPEFLRWLHRQSQEHNERAAAVANLASMGTIKGQLRAFSAFRRPWAT
jgi:hypothetical protein